MILKKIIKLTFLTALTFALICSSCYAASLGDVLEHFDKVMPNAEEYYQNGRNVYFADLPDDHWARGSIYYLAENGIISGMSENIFAPDGTTTVYQYIKLIVCSAAIVDEDAVSSYTDFTPDHWAYVYVASAQAAGALDIYKGDALDGDREITREDMAYIAYKVLSFRGFDIKSENHQLFSDDADISAYAKDAVYSLRRNGIISGSGNNMFNPQKTTSRAEASQIIYNMINFIEK